MDLFHTIAAQIRGQHDARGEDRESSRSVGEDVEMNHEAGLEGVLSPPSTDTPSTMNASASAQTSTETDPVMSHSSINAIPVAIDAQIPLVTDDDVDARSDQSMPHLEDVSDSDDSVGANIEPESLNGGHRRGPLGAEGAGVDVVEVGIDGSMMARVVEDSIGDGDRRFALGRRSSSGPQGTRRARVEDDAEGDSERDRRHPSQRTSTPINAGTHSSSSSTPSHSSPARSTPLPAGGYNVTQMRVTNRTLSSNGVPTWTFSRNVHTPQAARAHDHAQDGLDLDGPTAFEAFIDFTEAPGPELPPGINMAGLFNTFANARAGAGAANGGMGPIPGHPSMMSTSGFSMSAIPVGGVPGVGFGAAGPLPPHPHPHPHPHSHTHIHAHAPQAHGNPSQNGAGTSAGPGPTGNPGTGGPFSEFFARFGNALREAAQQNGNGPGAGNNADVGGDARGGPGPGAPDANANVPSAPNMNAGSEATPAAAAPGPRAQAQAQMLPGQQNIHRLANILQSFVDAGTNADGHVTTAAVVNGVPVNLGGGPAGANNNHGNNNNDNNADGSNGDGPRRVDQRSALASFFSSLARGQIPGGTFAFDPTTGGFAGGFPLFGFRPPQERDDPERASRMVDALEEVPVGLVRRLERVARESRPAGIDEGEGGQGDGGCAICWERLIEDDEVLLKMQEEEAKKKEKEEKKEREMKDKAMMTDEDTQMESLTEGSSSPSVDPASSSADTASSEPSSSTSSSQKKPKTPKYPRIIALPCAHVFHADCLIPWFSRPRQTTCPTCRFNIDPEGLTRHLARETATAAASVDAGGGVPGPAALRDHPVNANVNVNVPGWTNPSNPAHGTSTPGEPTTEAMGGGARFPGPGVISGGWFGPFTSSLDGPMPTPGRNAFTRAGFTIPIPTNGPQSFSMSSATPAPQGPSTSSTIGSQHSTPRASSSAPAGSSMSPSSGSSSSAVNDSGGHGDSSASGTSSFSSTSGATTTSTNVSSATGSTPSTPDASSGQAPPTHTPAQDDHPQGEWLSEDQARSLAQNLFGAIFGTPRDHPRPDQGARPHQDTPSAPQSTTEAPGVGVGNTAAGHTPNPTPNFGPFPHSHAHNSHHYHHHHPPPPPDAHDQSPNSFVTIGFDFIIGSGPPPPGAIPVGQFMGDMPRQDGAQVNRGANENTNIGSTGGTNANGNGGDNGNTNTGARNGPSVNPTAAGRTGTGAPGGAHGIPMNIGAMGLAVPLDMNGFGMPPLDIQNMDLEEMRDFRDMAVDMADGMDDLGDDEDEDHEGETHIHTFGFDIVDGRPYPIDFSGMGARATPRSETHPTGMNSTSTTRNATANSESQPESRGTGSRDTAAAQQGRSQAYAFPPWANRTSTSSASVNNLPSQQPQPPPARDSVRPASAGTDGSQPDGDADANTPPPENDHPPFSDYISAMLGRAMQGNARPAPAPAYAHTSTRTPRTWAPPPPPGLTLRQRIEKSEREAGLRCWDPSCGVGPSDEDPFVRIDDNQRRQVRVRQATGEPGSSADPKGKGKEKEKELEEEARYICTHTFHPPCLVSAQRAALNGAKENIVEGGRSVEVSCPVCRADGVVLKEDWEEGVRALQSS